uniref:Uncharacterized protein n=1 Tax=Anguilla anguilla TaxID=7936 RepID=A0A0E9QPU5_ANGAN
MSLKKANCRETLKKFEYSYEHHRGHGFELNALAVSGCVNSGLSVFMQEKEPKMHSVL